MLQKIFMVFITKFKNFDFEQIKNIHSSRFQFFLTALLLPCLFLLFGCNSTNSEPPIKQLPAETIQILSPAANASFTLNSTDTVRIIASADFSQFSSGLNFQFSIDSAKTWNLILSKVRKAGIEKDTVKWVPNDEIPGFIAPGQGVKLRVIDYGKKFFDISDFIYFKN